MIFCTYVHTNLHIDIRIYIYICFYINRCKSLYKSYASRISNYGPLTLRPRCCWLACLAMATADGTAVARIDAAGAPKDSFPKVFGDGGSNAFGVVSVAYPKKGKCGIYILDVCCNCCELIVLMYIWTIQWFIDSGDYIICWRQLVLPSKICCRRFHIDFQQYSIV